MDRSLFCRGRPDVHFDSGTPAGDPASGSWVDEGQRRYQEIVGFGAAITDASAGG